MLLEVIVKELEEIKMLAKQGLEFELLDNPNYCFFVPAAKLGRYITHPGFPSYYDPDFPTYNANLISEHLIAGEGVKYFHDDNLANSENTGNLSGYYNSVPRFLENSAFNQMYTIRTIIALGPGCAESHTPITYYDYFSKPHATYHYTPRSELNKPECSKWYEINSQAIPETEHSQLSTFQLDITRADNAKKQLTVHKIHIEDNNIITFTPSSIKKLKAIYLDNKQHKQHIFIHCAAGIGRTGYLIFALLLFDHFEEIFLASKEIKEIAAKIKSTLLQIRKHRHLIQAAIQFDGAIDLAIQLYTHRS